jgi:hypothetical protein
MNIRKEVWAMTARTIRKAAVEDVPALTHILNDAIAYKLSHGDFAWGKVGWTEIGVQQSLNRSEVYVIEQDDMPVATMARRKVLGDSRADRRLCAPGCRAQWLSRPRTWQLLDRLVRKSSVCQESTLSQT